MASRFDLDYYQEDSAEKRQDELFGLAARGLIHHFAVPRRWIGESAYGKYYEQSQQLTPTQLKKSVSDERKNLAIPMGRASNCLVFRVYYEDKKAFKELRSKGYLCSKDTYAVESVSCVDYYYGIGHLPFVIPTCHGFFGSSISLLAENSFVLAAGSFYIECGNDSFSEFYEVINDKEILLLPKILEDAIVKKFNLSPMC